LKLREKSDELEKPHSSEISVNERPGACDIKYNARSNR